LTKHSKIFFVLTGIFLAILVAIIIALVVQGSYDYAQGIAVKAVIWIIYSVLEVKYDIGVKSYIQALVITTIVSDSFLGLYIDLYTTSTVFDKVQHVFGSYSFSLFAYNLTCNLTQPKISRSFRFIFVISLGLGIGALYEIGEFLGDFIFKPDIPSQPSLLDTDLDLIADFIGALLAAIHSVTLLLIDNKRLQCK